MNCVFICSLIPANHFFFAPDTNSTHQILENNTPRTFHTMAFYIYQLKTQLKEQGWNSLGKNDIEAFYITKLDKPISKAAYNIWQEKYPDRLNLDINKLSNIRLSIIRNQRLTNLEFKNIWKKDQWECKQELIINKPDETPCDLVTRKNKQKLLSLTFQKYTNRNCPGRLQQWEGNREDSKHLVEIGNLCKAWKCILTLPKLKWLKLLSFFKYRHVESREIL